MCMMQDAPLIFECRLDFKQGDDILVKGYFNKSLKTNVKY